jgi:hypothetical protein
MAWLTPTRGLLLSVLAGLILGSSLQIRFGDSAFQPGRGRPESAIARDRASAAFAEWRMARVSDSVHRAIFANRPVDALVVGAGVPRGMVEAVRATIDESPAIPAASGTPRILVVLVIDTLSRVGDWEHGGRWLPRIAHVLPSSDGDPCITVVFGHPLDHSRSLATALSGRIPGPCGIYSAYGSPGPHISTWIQAMRGMPLQVHAATPHPPVGYTPTTSILDYTWALAEAEPEARCLIGRSIDCTDWMTRPHAGGIRALVMGDRVVLPGHDDWRFGLAGHFVSDLILLRGADRFRAFWTSDLPVTAAFEAAYGEPLGEWVLQWVRAMGIPAPRETRPPVDVVPLAALMSLLALGAALLYVSRRTVSA